jgi:hypothetical protein
VKELGCGSDCLWAITIVMEFQVQVADVGKEKLVNGFDRVNEKVLNVELVDFEELV